MRKSKTFVIGEHTYQIAQMGTSEAFDLWFVLLKTLGPSIAQAFPDNVDLDDLENMEINVAAASQMFFSKLEKADLKLCVETLKKVTMVVVDAETTLPLAKLYEDIFAGDAFGFARWLWCAMQFNFSDFLGELVKGAIMKKAEAKAAKQPLSATA